MATLVAAVTLKDSIPGSDDLMQPADPLHKGEGAIHCVRKPGLIRP